MSSIQRKLNLMLFYEHSSQNSLKMVVAFKDCLSEAKALFKLLPYNKFKHRNKNNMK